LNRLQALLPALLVACSVVGALTLLTDLASGTPMYAARSGRACDTCHLDPGKWQNKDLADRQCTLACVSCHVDPAGGGLRNAGGRFYGKAVLPMVATEPRPTQDWDRELLGLGFLTRKDSRTVYNDQFPRGPSTEEEGRDPQYAPHDIFALGGKPHEDGRGLTQGRYMNLNADPLFRWGWDVRVAMLGSHSAYGVRTLAFPMQFDLGMALHPVEHFTLLANVGARGRTKGLDAVFDDPSTPYLREAFLLVHELPYQAYVKAGRFTPAYGLRLDDHTNFFRTLYELDNSLPETRVTGVEVGAAANYPYVHASWFKQKAVGDTPDAWNIFDVDAPWGAALTAGYRELGWSAGGSFLHKERSTQDGGNRTVFGVNGALNLWHYSRSLPFTYLVEFDAGTRDRSANTTANQLSLYQELDWLAANGVNLLVGHNWEDPDRDVAFDEAQRLHFGIQIIPFSGVAIDARYRFLFPRQDADGFREDYGIDPKSADTRDFFIQLHLYN